ncbi:MULTISPECIES: AAA family ATPase [Acinetobacter]|uniref:AAA family ATPase n=1 Tax=Acinetobacter TaxID=469 RepID=UPI000992497E|nr:MULTISPECIES: AAA family ATPase [Acinetobacter]MCL6245264.1 AAA family ATPase [Acinetobacter amyesii]OOV80999.1 AAA family ATPase [Acinetobacter sp. ANC 5600]
MTEKLYYWAENLENYTSDNDKETNNYEVIEIKRLNFFIGKNNAGKSRFLRNLFQNTQGQQIYNSLQFRKLQAFTNHLIHSNQYNNHTYFTHFINTVEQIKPSNIGSANSNFSNSLNYLSRFGQLSSLYTNNNKSQAETTFSQEIEQNLNPIFTNPKFYIPILRGMRPVTDLDEKYPYIERAQKDYFKNQNKFNHENIITGERLYHELKVHLLGKPQQRELIKQYEEKLSQYFFDNETVTLIPYIGKDDNGHDNDVVHIKIGEDDQFPIHKLGDGLQQAIILTYEAYIKSKDKEGNTETHAFFIEEPELHMHAGMVRQLMNFYLNETPHYYFFTTHSNHLLDMADESDQVMIQKFVKQPKKEDRRKFDFKIYRCDRDRDLLASLGVRPSSVYLANCTIWVEGITDRLYITKYMEKYLDELKVSDQEVYKKYRRFMPNYHYTFVEYAGSNLVHWSFSDDYTDQLEDKGLSAKAVASEMLLIADGDIQSKADRVQVLKSELKKGNYLILECKETENTLPKDSIIRVATQRFKRMKSKTKDSYDISLTNNITSENYFDHKEYGIGKLLDIKLKKPSSKTTQSLFADGQGVGTIKYKLDFCREIIKDFDENSGWKLTPKAKALCERIYKHIEKCNS